MSKPFEDQTSIFSPEVILVLIAALEDAWASVQASGVLLEGDLADAKELLALRIIETAKKGERDPSRLVGDAVGYLVKKILTSGTH